MGLLFPLYLLGALAVAIPIALHLRRRPPKDRVEFSSLMFLDPQDPPRKNRTRLENWLLLVLRCLILILLALLFGRPFWQRPGAQADAHAGAGSVRLVLLDRSASMQRPGAWTTALGQARELADDAGPNDRLALAVFDRQLRVLFDFDTWNSTPPSGRKSQFRAALSEAKPGWAATALDEAAIAAADLVEEEAAEGAATREIAIISDFQEGAARARLSQFSWPDSIQVRLIPVAENVADNASLHLVAAADEESPADVWERPPRVRITTSADAARHKWRLGWGVDDPRAITVNVPPGATQVVTAPPRPTGDAAFLSLTGDLIHFDNRAYVAARQARPVQVVYLGEPEGLDPSDTSQALFYLTRSLGATPSLAPEVVARSEAGDLGKAGLVVVAGDLAKADARAADTFLRRGGTVLVLAMPNRPALLQSYGIGVVEAELEDYSLLEAIDFDDPVWRVFSAPETRDFGKIHFWQYRRLELPGDARVLARFGTGEPAFASIGIGQGELIISSANWIPAESQWPLSSKFVPFLYSLLSQAGFDSAARAQLYVGDRLPAAESIEYPDGTERAGESRATQPGVYRVRTVDREFSLAANVPPGESELERFALDSLPDLGIKASAGLAEKKVSAGSEEKLAGVELEKRQKMWKHLTLAVIVLLLVETWLANRAPGIVGAQPFLG